MTDLLSRNGDAQGAELPHHQTLLDGTDWGSLATPAGTGEDLPGALALLLDADPDIRAVAVRDALGAVTHQNSIYEATVPVALYVAAILGHPAIATGENGQGDARAPYRRPTRAALLDWLRETADDADDATVAAGERFFGKTFLDECPEIRAFRDLRPALYSGVRPLLDHEDAKVRHAALVAAVPLAEHPDLAPHKGELVSHANDLLTTSTDRRTRDRTLEALKAWGHDIRELETAEDIAARVLRARLAAEWDARTRGGYSEEPPF
ncbi:hypothetical protein [Streptomyces sp. NPDC048603]|uniref:hypothetical protein n=1 Tax=Streptomyces sp. NPDC048603 TaxID=3365577 RepID=UPI0037169A2F